eukprot:2523756-Pyramimonas_sp.AAC.1
MAVQSEGRLARRLDSLRSVLDFLSAFSVRHPHLQLADFLLHQLLVGGELVELGRERGVPLRRHLEERLAEGPDEEHLVVQKVERRLSHHERRHVHSQ